MRHGWVVNEHLRIPGHATRPHRNPPVEDIHAAVRDEDPPLSVAHIRITPDVAIGPYLSGAGHEGRRGRTGGQRWKPLPDIRSRVSKPILHSPIQRLPNLT